MPLKLYTPRQAALRLNISLKKLHRLLDAFCIKPCDRIDDRVMFDSHTVNTLQGYSKAFFETHSGRIRHRGSSMIIIDFKKNN
jgi:hypothetical protein